MASTPSTVGLFSLGEMGHSVAAVLVQHGVQVVTCLAGRSPRSQRLAAKAGVRDLPSVAEVVRRADIILSIVVPSAAPKVGAEVARAIRETGRSPLFVDANSISPSTVRGIERAITQAGGRFVDASIIGGAQGVAGGRATFYASGREASTFAGLREYGLRINVIGDEVGQASGLKMLYAGLTKGLSALSVELLLPARALGLLDPLLAKLQADSPDIANFMQRRILDLPMHAGRRSEEMEELAGACREMGLPMGMALAGRDSLKAIGDLRLRDRYDEATMEAWDFGSVLEVLAQGLTRQPDASH